MIAPATDGALDGDDALRRLALASVGVVGMAGPVADTHAAALAGAQLRRLPRLSQLALTATHRALVHSDLRARNEMGLVVGTGLGPLDETLAGLEQLGSREPLSPALFPVSVINVAAGQVAQLLDLQGFGATLCHEEISGELAVQTAGDALQLQRAPALLVTGVDVLGEATRAAYARVEPCVRLSEGAACLVLESLQHAYARGRPVLARLVATASAGASGRALSFRRAEVALGEALTRALVLAGWSAADVDQVICAGSGIAAQDRAEQQGLRRVFECQTPRVLSSAVGLGSFMADGVLRAVLATLAISDGAARRVLVCGVASGGSAAALALEAPC